MLSSIKFCDLTFRGLSRSEIFKESKIRMLHIVTVSSEFIIEAYKNERIREIINNNISTFDGQFCYILAKYKNRNNSFEKISGADFIYDIEKYAQKHNKRIFFLGGYPDSNSNSIIKMKEKGIEADGYVTGYISYPFLEKLNTDILNHIRIFKPHYIFVGLGMLKQEYWIDENHDSLEELGVEIVIGCGGTMEVYSGKINRAPKWIQRICLEGVYRILKEPNTIRLKRFIRSFKVLKYI